MSAECQEKNAKGLTMVAVGVNKAAEQYLILDEQTIADLATGKYHDQRRGSFGTSLPSSGNHRDARPAEVSQPHPQSRRRQPDEIAQKLGLSTYLVTQIILTRRNRGKL